MSYQLYRGRGSVEYVTLTAPMSAMLSATRDRGLTAWRTCAPGRHAASCVGGAGKVFSAGADAAWMAKMAEYSRDDTATRGPARKCRNQHDPGDRDRTHPGRGARRRPGLAAVCDCRPTPTRSLDSRNQARHPAGMTRPTCCRTCPAAREPSCRHAIRRQEGQGDRPGPFSRAVADGRSGRGYVQESLAPRPPPSRPS